MARASFTVMAIVASGPVVMAVARTPRSVKHEPSPGPLAAAALQPQNQAAMRFAPSPFPSPRPEASPGGATEDMRDYMRRNRQRVPKRQADWYDMAGGESAVPSDWSDDEEPAPSQSDEAQEYEKRLEAAENTPTISQESWEQESWADFAKDAASPKDEAERLKRLRLQRPGIQPQMSPSPSPSPSASPSPQPATAPGRTGDLRDYMRRHRQKVPPRPADCPTGMCDMFDMGTQQQEAPPSDGWSAWSAADEAALRNAQGDEWPTQQAQAQQAPEAEAAAPTISQASWEQESWADFAKGATQEDDAQEDQAQDVKRLSATKQEAEADAAATAERAAEAASAAERAAAAEAAAKEAAAEEAAADEAAAEEAARKEKEQKEKAEQEAAAAREEEEAKRAAERAAAKKAEQAALAKAEKARAEKAAKDKAHKEAEAKKAEEKTATEDKAKADKVIKEKAKREDESKETAEAPRPGTGSRPQPLPNESDNALSKAALSQSAQCDALLPSWSELAVQPGDVFDTERKGLPRRPIPDSTMDKLRWERDSFRAKWALNNHAGLLLMVDSECLLYLNVWKAGNDGIRESIKSANPDLPVTDETDPQRVLGRANDNQQPKTAGDDSGPFGVIVDGLDKTSQMAPLLESPVCANGSFAFTFVREPLSHFVSGFAEFAFRALPNRTQIVRPTARQTVTHLTQGQVPDAPFAASWEHMALMAGVKSSGVPLDFVGNLEEAGSDWAALKSRSALAGRRLQGISSAEAVHPTSADPQQARSTMVALLRAEPSTRRELCEALRPDYECFGYAFNACLDGRALDAIVLPATGSSDASKQPSPKPLFEAVGFGDANVDAQHPAMGDTWADAHPTRSRPHIFFHMLDDVGWYDVGFNAERTDRPSADVLSATSNVTALARQGIVLERHYAFHVCSPSRRAFLSGRLPIHHSEGLSPTRSDDLDLRWTTVGQKLEGAGYRSFWWGKGHTGYKSWRHLPVNLGFSAGFYGFLAPNQQHSNRARWYDNRVIDMPKPAPFSTYDYERRIVRAIKEHDVSVPMFMFIAWQDAHTPYDCWKLPDVDMAALADEQKCDGREHLYNACCMYALLKKTDEAIGRCAVASLGPHLWGLMTPAHCLTPRLACAQDHGGAAAQEDVGRHADGARLRQRRPQGRRELPAAWHEGHQLGGRHPYCGLCERRLRAGGAARHDEPDCLLDHRLVPHLLQSRGRRSH